MKIVILTEGGEDIGFGHITRCLSLSQAFEERKVAPEFIVSGDESIKGLLRHKKHKIFNWTEKQQELFQTIKNADIVIIDSYLADAGLYERVSQSVKISAYIDDNNRIDYPKGFIVNGSIYAEKLNYTEKKGIVYLLGSKYTLLRKEFWNIPEKEIKKDVENIMMTFGGDDLRGMTQKALKFLNKEYPELIKKVIIGRGYQNIKEIENLKDKKTDLIYYPDAEGMKRLMLGSDIAISSGGQTLYELARTGIPTIGICASDNQILNLEVWREKGFIEYIGWYDDKELIAKLKNAIHKLFSIAERVKYSKIGRVFGDGKGAQRVAENLINIRQGSY